MRLQCKLLRISVLCICFSSFIPNVTESVFAVPFASQGETYYLQRHSDKNKILEIIITVFKYQSIKCQLSVILDILIRSFTAVCNATVQLLQNERPYLLAIVISFIELRNNYTQKK
jgi:hypothetical protein